MAEPERIWASRKLGAESSSTRAALIEAAFALMQEEGYAAVTSRRVAARAELKPQLVHYYFRSMDDLYLEVFHHGADTHIQRMREIIQSDKPLRALWEFSIGEPGVNFTTEFAALATRNDRIRQELRRYGEEFRQLQTEAITRHLQARGIKPRIPPVLVTVLLVSLATVLVRERALGMSLGHAEAEALVEGCLNEFETTGRSALMQYE